MIFDRTIFFSDIIAMISIVLVVIGGIFAFIRWQKNSQVKRAEYINELVERIHTDKDIKKVLKYIEYDEKWYTYEFHGSGKLEEKVDKTFSYFSYICYLGEMKLISKKEFDFFRYKLNRILKNKQVKDYLYNLYHYSSQLDVPITFKYLFDYGKKCEFFEEDFFDKDSWKKEGLNYHHYLNF